MREMEGDAYRTGNVMLFRDWEDNYKQGSTIMNENKEMLEEVEEEEEETDNDDTEDTDEDKSSEEEDSGMTPAQEKYFGKKEESVKEWYSNELHEALLKKFKIKK